MLQASVDGFGGAVGGAGVIGLFVFEGVVSKAYWCVWGGGGCVVAVGRGRGPSMMGAATHAT